jgi:hypothetical protein
MHTRVHPGPRSGSYSPPPSPSQALPQPQLGTDVAEVAFSPGGGLQHQPHRMLDVSPPKEALSSNFEQHASPQVSRAARLSSPGRSQHQAYSLRRKSAPSSPAQAQTAVPGVMQGSTAIKDHPPGALADTSSPVVAADNTAASNTIIHHMYQGKGHPLPGLAEQDPASRTRAGSGVYDLNQQPTSSPTFTTVAPGSSIRAASVTTHSAIHGSLHVSKDFTEKPSSPPVSPPGSPGSHQYTAHGRQAVQARSASKQGYAAAADARSAWKVSEVKKRGCCTQHGHMAC